MYNAPHGVICSCLQNSSHAQLKKSMENFVSLSVCNDLIIISAFCFGFSFGSSHAHR